VSDYDLPSEATGPFVLSGYSGYKQVQLPRGRLFAFDSEGNYMLTCSSTGGVIFKVSLSSDWDCCCTSIQALVAATAATGSSQAAPTHPCSVKVAAQFHTVCVLAVCGV